jgi:hypothetical protein
MYEAFAEGKLRIRGAEQLQADITEIIRNPPERGLLDSAFFSLTQDFYKLKLARDEFVRWVTEGGRLPPPVFWDGEPKSEPVPPPEPTPVADEGDRAEAATTAIEATATEEDDVLPASEVVRRKRGRPPELPLEVKEQFFEKLNRVGVPRLDHPDPKWRAKARAAEFIEDNAHMARSTSFEYVDLLIEEWEKRKSGKSDN